MVREETKFGKTGSGYETPVIRVLVLTQEDVITASTDVGEGWPGDWTEQ